MGKQVRKSYPKRDSRASDLLELVHFDICGSVEVSSIGGSRYSITFVDDASKKVAVYFLTAKGEVLAAFKLFQAKAKDRQRTGIRFQRISESAEEGRHSSSKDLPIHSGAE